MALRTVTVNLGQSNLLTLASKVMGVPGASANRMIEAAIRAYRGEDKDEIISRVSRYDSRALHGGGAKHARVDDGLLSGIENISRAGRIGLAMLMYDMTLQEAAEWEAGRVPIGRPRKKVNADRSDTNEPQARPERTAH